MRVTAEGQFHAGFDTLPDKGRRRAFPDIMDIGNFAVLSNDLYNPSADG